MIKSNNNESHDTLSFLNVWNFNYKNQESKIDSLKSFNIFNNPRINNNNNLQMLSENFNRGKG